FSFIMVSTTSFLNSGVYRLFGTPFGIKITPPVKHYIILSNKWGAVHGCTPGLFCCQNLQSALYKPLKIRYTIQNTVHQSFFCGAPQNSFFVLSTRHRRV
ncbi:hypothetical protein, partial [Hominenteromicrobium sp.]|uniref:hypothetical protein n=1 Tax=Hominenteromicrobium sp. TaxID=3073581 RepID=UPI003A92278F